MQRKLANAVDSSMPRFNEEIVDGFHKREFERARHYYGNWLRMTFKGLEDKGVYYRGVVKVPPKEYISYLNSTQAKIFDVHKETLYPVKILFDYKDKTGKMIPQKPVYQMLPYTNEYGDVFLRGVFYSLQFVLAERGLPVAKDNSLFVKVLGFKFKVGDEYFKYDIVTNDLGYVHSIPTSINLAANRLYSPTEARRITVKRTPIPLLAWYVFAKHGFGKSMEKYTECEYVIGGVDTLLEQCPSKDGWVVMKRSSTPNNRSLGPFISNDYGIAIRNKSRTRTTLSPMGEQYAASLLVVMDCMSSYFDIDRIDDPLYWRLIIGRTSVKPGDLDDYILRLMNEHFDSISGYMDEESVQRFANHGIVVDDMFELFNYIIVERSNIIQNTDRADGFGKELASLEFTLDRLITSANDFKHDIKNNSELNQSKIAKFLSSNFLIKEIDNARDANLIQEATPTDNPFVDYMLGCIAQDKLYNKSIPGRRGGFDTGDSSTHIHPSLPFVYSHLRVTKPSPDGRGFLSPCLNLVNGRLIALDPEMKDLYERTKKRLTVREIRRNK